MGQAVTGIDHHRGTEAENPKNLFEGTELTESAEQIGRFKPVIRPSDACRTMFGRPCSWR